MRNKWLILFFLKTSCCSACINQLGYVNLSVLRVQPLKLEDLLVNIMLQMFNFWHRDEDQNEMSFNP
jgi:hypothetical protein